MEEEKLSAGAEATESATKTRKTRKTRTQSVTMRTTKKTWTREIARPPPIARTKNISTMKERTSEGEKRGRRRR